MFNRDQLDHKPKSLGCARQAAEALFQRKDKPEKAPNAETPEVTERRARVPRILRALPHAPAGYQKIEVLPAPEKRAGRPAGFPASKTGPEGVIPASHVGRIRTWLKYGMTAPEVARVYGVAVSVVERLL